MRNFICGDANSWETVALSGNLGAGRRSQNAPLTWMTALGSLVFFSLVLMSYASNNADFSFCTWSRDYATTFARTGESVARLEAGDVGPELIAQPASPWATSCSWFYFCPAWRLQIERWQRRWRYVSSVWSPSAASFRVQVTSKSYINDQREDSKICCFIKDFSKVLSRRIDVNFQRCYKWSWRIQSCWSCFLFCRCWEN